MTIDHLAIQLLITSSNFQVLLRKENMVSAPNVAANDDIAQQYLSEEVADNNNTL